MRNVIPRGLVISISRESARGLRFAQPDVALDLFMEVLGVGQVGLAGDDNAQPR